MAALLYLKHAFKKNSLPAGSTTWPGTVERLLQGPYAPTLMKFRSLPRPLIAKRIFINVTSNSADFDYGLACHPSCINLRT